MIENVRFAVPMAEKGKVEIIKKSCQSNICLSSSMKKTLNKLENLLA